MWREETSRVLKKHLVRAKDGKSIREIAGAIRDIYPYEYEGPGMPERPMPVRIVKSSKPKTKPKKMVLRQKA